MLIDLERQGCNGKGQKFNNAGDYHDPPIYYAKNGAYHGLGYIGWFSFIIIGLHAIKGASGLCWRSCVAEFG